MEICEKIIVKNSDLKPHEEKSHDLMEEYGCNVFGKNFVLKSN